MLRFKVVVGAVEIAYRGIAFDDVEAAMIKLLQIAAIVIFKKIHETEDVLVIKGGLFVVGRKPVKSTKL